MNNDLIENHLKNIESLEKLKVNTEINFNNLKKIQKIDKKVKIIKKNESIYQIIIYYLKNSYNLIYFPLKYTYIFCLSLIIFYYVHQKRISFQNVFRYNQNKCLL